MSFAEPIWFWGLLALPVLVALFIAAEKRTARRLQEFVSPRLLPQLTATVDRFRRATRFGFVLLALAFALAALARPQWGYSFEDVKRKGIDLLVAVDTSRSMLSNDVQPNRLQRVKLAALDLITELQGDRVGLIAFAGRAFLQAPLTIDYDAAIEAINDLDTKTIPEGGTNISEAINLATRTYGKSAVGNRALVIFTDGEELNGDALKAAKTAGEAGIRIFTIGVGTPQGSLIPLAGEGGGSAFVKDNKGQVVKSKLDETRLREIAQTTGGFYLHLENGPRTMHQLFADGLAEITAKEMDVRLNRRPIERYEWPLAGATVALATSILIRERKRTRLRSISRPPMKLAPAAVAISLLLLSAVPTFSAVSGLNFYRDGKYPEAYQAFQDDLKAHPDSPEKDKMHFDAGAAAYQMREYDKAAEAFSQSLLTGDKKLQEHSHYNMGRTLEERADMAKSDEGAITDLENALGHYQDVLKLNPNNPGAKANIEEVKKKIERLKKKKQQKPTPPPQQQQKKDKKQSDSQDQQKSQGGSSNQNQQQQSPQNQDQNKPDQNQQQQSQANNQQGGNKDQQQQQQQQKDQKDELQAKNDRKSDQQQSDAGQSPSPSPQPQSSGSPSPSPSEGKQNAEDKSESGKEDQQPSPTPGEGNEPATSPSPGEGEGAQENPADSPSPAQSPQKKFAGEIKGTSPEQSPPPNQPPQMADVEPEKEGEMSERQARALLQAMKNDEARVQLDERRAARRVYNDW